MGRSSPPLAQASIKAAGGRQVAIGGVGGAGENPVTTHEGAPPKGRVVIQAWDSLEQLKAWFNSDAYVKARKIGEKYATFRRYAFDGKSN